MRMRLTFAVILILSCLHFKVSNAQNLSKLRGTIVTESRLPIEYVYILAENDSTLKETLTDSNGKFEVLVKNGTCKLKGVYFSEILFENELSITSDLNLDTLYLSPILSLEEVVVEASHDLVSHREDKLIFDVRKLSKTEGYNATDVLKYVPKVIVDFDGRINVGSKQAAVYLNNRRLSSDEIVTTLKNLQAEDIAEIEVQSTHGGVYGVDIEGGVVHIKTVTNRTGFNGTAQLYAAYPKSDYYTLSPNLNLFFGKEKWNIYTGYSFNHGKGGSYSETTNHFIQNNIIHESSGEYTNKPNSHTYKIGSLWDMNKDHTISVEFNGIANNPGKSLSSYDINLLEDHVLIDRAKSENNYLSSSDFYNVALYHEWRIDTLNSNLITLANYNNKQNHSDNIHDSRYELLHDKNVFEQNISTADANNYSLKSDLRKNFANSLSLRAGIQYSYSKRKSDLRINNLASSDNANEQWAYNEGIVGTYIGLSKNIGNVYLYGNVRVEHTYIDGKSGGSKTLDKNYTEIYPYMTINHTLSPKLSYSILYTKYIFRPSFNLMNNYSNRISDVLYDVGNPDLKPQNTHTGQVALNYGNYSTSFEVNYTPDAITEFFEERDGITYHTNLNYGSVTRIGINNSFSSNIFKWWYTNLYVYGGYEHIPKSYNKKELFRGFINSNNRFSIPVVGDIQLSFNYNSGSINGNAYNKRNYGMDISYSRSFVNNSVNVQLGVSDIFNTRDYRSRNYVPTLEYLFYSKPLSRNFWMRLTYNFNTKEKVNKQRLKNQNSIINRL